MGRFLVLLAFICSVSVGLPDDSLSPKDVDLLRQLLIDGLGLKKIPNVSEETHFLNFGTCFGRSTWLRMGVRRTPETCTKIKKINISPEEYATKLAEYNKLVEENKKRRREEAVAASASRMYTFKPSGKEKTSDHKKTNTNHLYFAIERKPGIVKEATLRVFAKRTSNRKPVSVQFRIFQITENERKLIDRRQVEITESRWIDLQVKRAVSAWMSGAEKNYGLDIECRRCSRKGVTLAMPSWAHFNVSTLPVINVVVNERGLVSRRRRNLEDEAFHSDSRPRTNCYSNDREKCCRHEMEVKFDDLPGFGFIIQPRGFDAGFCTGRCPVRHNPANHHALIQSLVYMQNKTWVPKLCCAPSKLIDIEILHIDEDDHSMLKVSSWKSMKVSECACN